MAKQTGETNYTVRMSENAEKDLNEIILVVCQNNPKTAEKVLKRIETKISSLSHSPNKGAHVHELASRNIKEYRQITESPWKIIYRVNDNAVNILAIIVSRRNLHSFLLDSLLD